jgi:hypothetical protein
LTSRKRPSAPSVPSAAAVLHADRITQSAFAYSPLDSEDRVRLRADVASIFTRAAFRLHFYFDLVTGPKELGHLSRSTG